jgi:glycerophosphoryl diester phosphodiesterase
MRRLVSWVPQQRIAAPGSSPGRHLGGGSRVSAPVELIAHRAGNDPGSLRRRRGDADLVEVDVHWSGGDLEVRHAKVLWPTRRLWERWHLLPAGTPVPSFADVLDAAGPDTHLLVDLKGPLPRVGRQALVALGQRRPVTVSSKAWWVLRPFRGTGVRTVRSAGNRAELALLRWLPVGRRVDGFGLHRRLCTPRVVAELRRRTDVVFAWAVDDDGTAHRLARWGVTGLIVDDPDLLGRLAADRPG